MPHAVSRSSDPSAVCATQTEGDAVDAVVASADALSIALAPMYGELQEVGKHMVRAAGLLADLHQLLITVTVRVHLHTWLCEETGLSHTPPPISGQQSAPSCCRVMPVASAPQPTLCELPSHSPPAACNIINTQRHHHQ